MSASTLSIAIDHAKYRRRVALCCPPGPNGECTCGGKWDDKRKQLVPHDRKEVGKAPIGRFFPKGINDATTNTATLDRFLREMPEANVSIELQSAGFLVVDTDSPEAEAAELPYLDGAVVRESRNRAYVFKRPADCPIINLIKADGDQLDILTFGNFLVHGTHASGAQIRLDPHAKPGPAPARYVEMLKRKAAENAAAADAAAARRTERAATYGNGPEPPVRLHQRGQRRWTGDLVEPDRSDSLFYIGLDLAECGASESAIVAALEERDAALGFNKYTDRKDDREYVRIAEKAAARAVAQEQAPQLVISPKAPSDGSINEVMAFAEATAAENARLISINTVQATRIRALTEERDELANRLARWKATLSNPKLKPVDRVCAIPLAENIEAAQKTGQEEIHVRVKGIVNGWGIPRSTFDKSVATLTERDGAPLGKRTDQKVKEWGPNPESYFWAADGGDVWDALAIYDPKLPQRGGKRNPDTDTCVDHPAADIIQRTVKLCSVDSKPIAPATQKRLRRHFEDLGTEGSGTVSDRTLGGHFDDVGGHDGEEQSRAAAMVATQLVRPTVDSWKQPTFSDPDPARTDDTGDSENPPDWLDAWPDEPIRMSDRRANVIDPGPDARHTEYVDVGAGDDPPPSRCATSGCTRPTAPGDGWYCAPCRVRVSEPAVMAGAEE